MIYVFKNILSSLVPIKIILNNYNPVLLYHSLGVNSNFKKNNDHVSLDVLYSQLESVKKHWRFVSIDEYVLAKNKKGLSCVTIDDGYKNVIDDSLEVFQNLNIHITIFINSSSFHGKIFWRDKVRYLIENNLVEKYVKKSPLFEKSHIDKFYYITKNPIFNSKKVENDIDNFLFEENLELNNDYNLCFDSQNYLIKNDLVSYGNHTANHYMLSSLTEHEQSEEIIKCKDFLDTLHVNKSKVFCLPFGGDNSFNNDTLLILKNLNYKTILKSTNNLNINNTNSNQINRFMPTTNNIENTIKKLYFKKILNR